MPSSLQVVPQGRTARVSRRPQHTFNVVVRPFEICPVFIAPVVPGETMKNLLFQARVVSDPVKDPLVGWWCEFYFFYIKHRDLNERDVLTSMMIDPSVSAPITATAQVPQYCFAGGVDYVTMCLQRVTETFFRDTGELWNGAKFTYCPVAQISQQCWLDSALPDSSYTAGAPGLVVGVDDTITGAEIDQTWLLWQQYRASNLTHLSYEEYLSTYGIPLPAGSESSHRPELIRYVKDWSYPTNTINPSTGAPTSAVSWAVAERADKDRFFREPGFLFGVCCVRPKCYLGTQKGSVSGALKDALSWLPAVLGSNPEYSVRRFATLTGPVPTATVDYRIDLKDLFLYGEQFTNLSPPANAVAMPQPLMRPGDKKYPQASDADAFFTTPGTANHIRMDGVVSLNILGMQVDTSPTQAPGTF